MRPIELRPTETSRFRLDLEIGGLHHRYYWPEAAWLAAENPCVNHLGLELTWLSTGLCVGDGIRDRLTAADLLMRISPLLIRASGESEVLCGTASVIGAFASWEGTEGGTHLGPNDTLLIYSDGVVEAGMDRDEPFGIERVHQIVLAHRAVTPNQVLDGLFTALAAHSRGAQHDDQTAVCLMGR